MCIVNHVLEINKSVHSFDKPYQMICVLSYQNLQFSDSWRSAVKGIVHPKLKMLSSFNHPQVVPNLYECFCSAEQKGIYLEECDKQ